jgi:hypothetical protein
MHRTTIGFVALLALLPFAVSDGTVTFDFYEDLECKGQPFQSHKAGVFGQFHRLDNSALFRCFKIRDVSQSLFGIGAKAVVALADESAQHYCTYDLSNYDHSPHTFDPGEWYGIGHQQEGCNF